MKLHILSDLHLEFLAYAPPALDADAVVLAGDIGLGTRGIQWAREAWPDTEIVYVPGNHEYYRSEMGVENELLRAAAREHGVHLLNRDAAVIGGVRFLGATLWTDFRLFGDRERFHALQGGLHGLSDFPGDRLRAADFHAGGFGRTAPPGCRLAGKAAHG